MFVMISYSIFIGFIYVNDKEKIIEIDNEFKLNLYEDEITFKKKQNKVKAIALYYPEYNNISISKYFNVSEKYKSLNYGNIKRLIEAQVKLAKRHEIYGFAISFYLFKYDFYNHLTINIFLNTINFPFFLNWRNDELETIEIHDIELFVEKIKKYMVSDNYIKIMKKPILSIQNPYKYLNIQNIILTIRKEAKKKINEIFIIYPFTGNFNNKFFLKEFDAAYDHSKIDLFPHTMYNNSNILYYSGIIYKNLVLNELNFDFPLLRSCYLNNNKFNDYNPEKFYISNKIIFNFGGLKKIKSFVFIDSWNNYKIGNYLEPDQKYGFASINSFSKSILNIPFRDNKYYFNNNRTLIAVQLHAYYEDLSFELINKINLIPLKYDLFISTVSKTKKKVIEKFLWNSTANKYEIRIFENKGRDVLPFINQMKKNFKNYKYICHIHTKKSSHNIFLGDNWREYIYSNLLGSKDIISDILYNFESNQKIGIIFPEPFYDIIKENKGFDNINFFLNRENKNNMNLIIKMLFKKYKLGEKLIFPVGNMFWSRTKAIYQIFYLRLTYPKELNQTNETIMHAIERIWIYLVKLNGFYYKTIFKHY